MKSFSKIFGMIFVPTFLIIIITSLYVKNIVFDIYEQITIQNLKKMENVLYNQIDPKKIDFENYQRLNNIYNEESLRITVIDKKTGGVIFENGVHFEDIPKIENHSNRPEFVMAVKNGDSFSIRESGTPKKKLIYYAKAHEDYIIRVAYPEFFFDEADRRMKRILFSFLFVTFITLAAVSAFIAKKITVPAQKLDYIADMIQSGNENIQMPEFRDPTMSRVSSLIFTIYHLMLEKQRLIENEQEKNNFILSTLDEAIVLLDEKNIIIKSNSKFYTYFKIDDVGRNIFDTTTDYETISLFKKILLEDTPPKQVAHYKKREIEMYVKSIKNHKLLVFNDITEKKSYESLKSELVANVSHELKTPLSMIMGYAETILSDSGMEEETKSKFVKKIYDSSVRLNELIEDIIKLHKLERLGSDFCVDEPFSSSELLEDILSLYSSASKKVNISILEGVYFIEYEHIMSVITNLIDNALKYSRGPEVDFTLAKDGKIVTIEVADQGPIISDDEKKKIFTRFYTTSKSRNRDKSGTGLGLSIVKHITEIYKGEVEILRNDKFGNTFRVSILEKKPSGNVSSTGFF